MEEFVDFGSDFSAPSVPPRPALGAAAERGCGGSPRGGALASPTGPRQGGFVERRATLAPAGGAPPPPVVTSAPGHCSNVTSSTSSGCSKGCGGIGCSGSCSGSAQGGSPLVDWGAVAGGGGCCGAGLYGDGLPRPGPAPSGAPPSARRQSPGASPVLGPQVVARQPPPQPPPRQPEPPMERASSTQEAPGAPRPAQAPAAAASPPLGISTGRANKSIDDLFDSVNFLVV